jgi:hypothetical protein
MLKQKNLTKSLDAVVVEDERSVEDVVSDADEALVMSSDGLIVSFD